MCLSWWVLLEIVSFFFVFYLWSLGSSFFIEAYTYVSCQFYFWLKKHPLQIWKYQGVDKDADCSLALMCIDVQTPEGQCSSNSLITGGKNGCLRYVWLIPYFYASRNCVLTTLRDWFCSFLIVSINNVKYLLEIHTNIRIERIYLK